MAAPTGEENLLREESKDMESLIDKLPAIYFDADSFYEKEKR